MSTFTFTSQAIECQGCARAISAALRSIDGVDNVDVDVDQKRVNVAYDETKTNQVALAAKSCEEGFPVDA
jgi:copper chaperone CopZ